MNYSCEDWYWDWLEWREKYWCWCMGCYYWGDGCYCGGWGDWWRWDLGCRRGWYVRIFVWWYWEEIWWGCGF